MKTSLVGLLLFGLSILVHGAPNDSPSDTIPPDPSLVTDGPFVSWAGDSSLTVSYICYGEHHQKSVSIDELATIPDCCFDILPGELTVRRTPFPDEPIRFENISRVMAVSDIHGEYDALVRFLQTNNLVDDSLNWIWGDGHLVIDGDIFDRGDQVYETIWLVYRLQQQAGESGGAVHYLLANHELMVIRGDDRYLNAKYTGVTLPVLGKSHRELIDTSTIIGQWLRTRPVTLMIDSILFVHGGISMDLMRTGMSMEQINSASLSCLDLSREEVKADSIANLLYGSMGPFWYRGMVWEYNSPKITRPELDSILNHFRARSVVVGHSEHEAVTALFDAHLFAIDIPVDAVGGFEGWLLRDQKFYRVTPDGQLHLLGFLDRTPPSAPGSLR